MVQEERGGEGRERRLEMGRSGWDEEGTLVLLIHSLPVTRFRVKSCCNTKL